MGGPRGDLGKRYFSLKYLKNQKISFRCSLQNIKWGFPKSPRGPPTYIFEKYGISAFTGKKNYPSSYFCSVFTFLWNQTLKSVQNVDSGEQTRRKQYKILCSTSLQYFGVILLIALAYMLYTMTGNLVSLLIGYFHAWLRHVTTILPVVILS